MHHNGSDSESSEMLNWYQLRITDIKDCFIAGLLYGPCKWVAQFKSFASFLWNKFKPNQFRHLIPPPFAERAGIKIKFIRNISDQHLYLPKREKKRWRIFLSFFNHRHRLFSKSPSPWKISKFTRISPLPFPSLFSVTIVENRVLTHFFPPVFRAEKSLARRKIARAVRLCVPPRILRHQPVCATLWN